MSMCQLKVIRSKRRQLIPPGKYPRYSSSPCLGRQYRRQILCLSFRLLEQKVCLGSCILWRNSTEVVVRLLLKWSLLSGKFPAYTHCRVWSCSRTIRRFYGRVTVISKKAYQEHVHGRAENKYNIERHGRLIGSWRRVKNVIVSLPQTAATSNNMITEDSHLVSQVAPGPSVVVRPGGLVWMKVAPFPFSSILSRSMTSLLGSCLVYAIILAPKSAIIWSVMTSLDSFWKYVSSMPRLE